MVAAYRRDRIELHASQAVEYLHLRRTWRKVMPHHRARDI
jgi:hypothetical protein